MIVDIRTGCEAYPVVQMWRHDDRDPAYPPDGGGPYEVPDGLWQEYEQAIETLRRAEQAILDHCGIDNDPLGIGTDDDD